MYTTDERFEYARKLKDAMTELRLAGEKLGKLELSKTQAIQNEDYGKAKKKKTQMEEYRVQVLLENRIDDLLEKNGVSLTVRWDETLLNNIVQYIFEIQPLNIMPIFFFYIL